ncbi:MarR family transcriptional regulator [Halomarina litorea]|uniref:MarR family transcriptional regulator n=1 Tax=Halomarina litorea TaxID=2961595 RepID=UPI0020C1E2D8|nr:helix-turn-helix domain-containing protein [Halomarina sp. BCD28]
MSDQSPDESSPNDPPTEIPEAVVQLSPSCCSVYLLLEEHGPLTQQAIVRTGLKRRTVRHALTRLEDGGLVASRPYVADSRQRLYDTVVAEE